MRRLIAASIITLALAMPLSAGEVDNPGKTPCTQNCSSTSTTPEATMFTEVLLTAILAVIGR